MMTLLTAAYAQQFDVNAYSNTADTTTSPTKFAMPNRMS
jgi:hypothetical protein